MNKEIKSLLEVSQDVRDIPYEKADQILGRFSKAIEKFKRNIVGIKN